MQPSSKKSKPTFDQFKTFGEPVLEAGLSAAKAFASAIIANPWSGGHCLSLLGKSGNGKTMLTQCVLSALKVDAWNCAGVVSEVIAGGKLKRFECVFKDWRRVSDALKNGEWGITDALELPEFLVLDDIGADYDPKSIAASKLDRVLRSRKGKWTMVTSNLLLPEINKQMDARIASFLIREDNKFVNMTTKDFWLR